MVYKINRKICFQWLFKNFNWVIRNDMAIRVSRIKLALQRFWCLVGKHDYKTTQELSPGTRRIGCPVCGMSWAMNDNNKILLGWDIEFHHAYEKHGVKIAYKTWEKQAQSAAAGLEETV